MELLDVLGIWLVRTMTIVVCGYMALAVLNLAALALARLVGWKKGSLVPSKAIKQTEVRYRVEWPSSVRIEFKRTRVRAAKLIKRACADRHED
jgi:hypothetical protein